MNNIVGWIFANDCVGRHFCNCSTHGLPSGCAGLVSGILRATAKLLCLLPDPKGPRKEESRTIRMSNHVPSFPSTNCIAKNKIMKICMCVGEGLL